MIGNRLSTLLLLLAAGFGALAAWQWQAAPGVARPVVMDTSQSPSLPRSDTPALLLVPPLADLSQTRERPLFERSRRPPRLAQVVTATPPPAPKRSDPQPLAVELSAVILEPDRQFALFRQVGLQSVLRAEVGQIVDGWTLSAIRADSVTLERDSERQDLVLRTFKQAPPPPPPARPSAAKATKAAKAAGQATARARDVRRPRRALRDPRRRSIQRRSPVGATQQR